MAGAREFRENWISSLMGNLEKHVDSESLACVMEDCGRDCARRSSIRPLAEACEGDVDGLVSGLAKILGKDNCRREGDKVRVIYPKCYCEMVSKGPEDLPESYCLCSRGWVLEMFETAAGRPLEVEMLSTIKRGDPQCEIVIQL